MESVGWIGLGQMGLAMATNLQRAGVPLRVYNRTPEKAKPLVEAGAILANTPAEVAEPGGIVFSMLTDDNAVMGIVADPEGFIQKLGKGGIHVSMSTISPMTGGKLAKAHESYENHYVACPVFGKPDVAAAGKLWMAISGNAEAKGRVAPILAHMGQGTYDFGETPEAAHVVKLAGNFLVGAAIEAMAEALTLAEKNGIARESVHAMFSETIFASPVYKNYGRMIAAEDYKPVGAAPALIRKDMRLVLETAQRSNVPMPLASLVHDRLTALVAKGVDDIDWAGFAGEVSLAAGIERE